jgi:nucleoside-diphosphate-sugar epimerase
VLPEPVRWSLEDDSVAKLALHLTSTKTEAVVFAAGAGGGDPARTRKVDYEGALKVADAVEQAGLKRLLMVSAADLRDRSQPPPEHYNDADIALSE